MATWCAENNGMTGTKHTQKKLVSFTLLLQECRVLVCLYQFSHIDPISKTSLLYFFFTFESNKLPLTTQTTLFCELTRFFF